MQIGEVVLDHLDEEEKSVFRRRKIGFIFQNFVLMEEKTVRQNLEIIQQKNRTKISIEKALELVKMGDKADSKVYTLSGGEQQRVALARLLVKKCSLILADEPTGSLDRSNAKLVMGILNKTGRADYRTVTETE